MGVGATLRIPLLLGSVSEGASSLFYRSTRSAQPGFRQKTRKVCLSAGEPFLPASPGVLETPGLGTA